MNNLFGYCQLPSGRFVFWATWLLLVSGIGMRPGIALGEEQFTVSKKKMLRIGYSLTTLLAVNPKDAEAATDVLVGKIADQKGADITVDTRVFDSVSRMTSEILAGRLHLVSVLGQEYLDIKKKVVLNTLFVPLRNAGVYEEILLIVRRDVSNSGLKSLMDKRLLISVSLTNELPYLWLDSILLSADLPQSREYLGNIEEVTTPSRTVLPVLFGQADACMTINSAYETLKALNPQIGEELVILETSVPLLMSVLCTTEGMDEELETLVREGIQQLPEYAEGRQLLTLFGVDGHVLFREEYLEGTKSLIKRAEKLRKEQGLPEL